MTADADKSSTSGPNAHSDHSGDPDHQSHVCRPSYCCGHYASITPRLYGVQRPKAERSSLGLWYIDASRAPSGLLARRVHNSCIIRDYLVDASQFWEKIIQRAVAACGMLTGLVIKLTAVIGKTKAQIRKHAA